ncbi:MAG: hypothetical protein JSR11_03720 [Bacteroidetes bacterium]|nr:hypothetical protein [Bacteroidota bacterium]
MKINSKQKSAVYALLNKTGLIAQKEIIVSGFSNGRTTHISNLASVEISELIKYLKTQDPDEKKAEQMRRKIIAIARSMGWQQQVVDGAGKLILKADMKRIDNWCLNFGYLHKKLNQYLYNELPKLVSQIEMIQKNYLKKL